MGDSKVGDRVKNVGFISTRISGTDGVSLELEKWAAVFKTFGWTSFYFAGELDRPPERSYLVEEAHFTHPDIKDIHNKVFGVTTRERALSKKIYQMAIKIKDDLYDFVKKIQYRSDYSAKRLDHSDEYPSGNRIDGIYCRNPYPYHCPSS